MSRRMWSPLQIETLTTMWRNGSSCIEIARALKEGITRNAVIGKITRLGLQKKATPRAHRERSSLPKPKARAPIFAFPRPVAVEIKRDRRPLRSEPLTPTPTTNTLGVGLRQCRWPIGDPRSDDYGVCGRPAEGPYCPAHAKIAYTPSSPEAAERRAKERVANTLRKFA